ncbi:MAG: pyrroline-5-carboxylate reductase [Clostridiales bacterium]|nr:pyrroline-5-carboxylate reductase [Clostridia bacterium]MCR4564020.1 pyrroline-5-carboxylate reductase [Clostridiales bacterium]
MKIGFIGGGNMASAIIRGAVTSESFSPSEISVFDVDETKSDSLKNSLGICKADTLSALIDESDVLVLAVKPNIFPVLIPEIREQVSVKKPLVISIAAGKTVEYITDLFGFSLPVVRVMPNLNAEVFEAISAYCPNEKVTSEHKNTVEKLLNSFGSCICLEEEYFSIFSVVGGCAPAYSFLFISALAEGAKKYGLPEELALKVASQTVLGSAKMLLKEGADADELIRRVCSPGGTTIEGINSLRGDGFVDTVIKAMKASYDKDKRM